MKQYSRGQLVFFSIASGMVVVLLAIGFGLFGWPGDEPSPRPSDVAGEVAPVPAADFQLRTNTAPLTPVSTRTDFSDDELENITIFDLRNEGVVNITTETISYNWFLEPVPERGACGRVAGVFGGS